uniref:Uncharacterized protein n=1 Tax=Alexandrium monilatum TaxID=311494 RepID=A0A6T0S9J3_9DINO|mmetsp:Transcript_23881/g.71319  ORF Transcript_23881/g.71319 Transcript_23881/m.71319 type:complete len:176 (-) Transcript_23881:126-653(-)
MAGLGVSVLLDELEAKFSPESSPARSVRRPPPPSASSFGGTEVPAAAPETPTSDFISELCRELENEKQQRIKEHRRQEAAAAAFAATRRLRFEAEPVEHFYDRSGDAEGAFAAAAERRSSLDDLVVEGHALLAPGGTGYLAPLLAGRRDEEEIAGNFGSTCDSSLSGLLDGSFFQ